MSIGRVVGGTLIAVAAAVIVYTIVGAVNTVWGVSQLSEMPIPVKLFLPVIFGTLGGTLGVMAVQRVRRRNHADAASDPTRN